MWTRTALFRVFFLVIAAALVAPIPGEAQVWKRMKQKAKETVERKAEQKTEAAVTVAIDGLEGAVVCAVTDDPCIEQAQADGKPVVMTDSETGEIIRDDTGAPVTDPDAAKAQASGGIESLAPGEGAWANYDFVPGHRVLFSDDFSDEYVGDFPRRLTYVRGNMEVVEWEGRRLLRGTGGDRFVILIPEGLPDQYTIEFDIHDPTTEGGTAIYPAALDNGSYEGHYVNIGSWRGSGIWGEGPVSTNAIDDIEETIVPIRIAVDNGYVKIYARERRIANVPQVDFPDESTGLTFHLYSSTTRPIYLGNLRVAEGGRTRIYQELHANGRFATRGILFDTGSARIQPESTPTLTEIAGMMKQHGDLRLRVEGHTDNVGAPDANLTLSEARAQAVVDYLVGQNIAANRLEAVGQGATQPTASNATPEGRQTNRRVELVVL